MIADFYRRHSMTLIISCLIALPVLTWYGERMPSNNDIEAWLPNDSQVRRDYDEFVRTFGADETILVGFQKPFPAPERLNSLARRLGSLPGVGACWTRGDVVDLMTANHVDAATADERLLHLLRAPAGDLETLMLSLKSDRFASRSELLEQIRSQLQYCDMENAIVAGAPVVTSQLDMLGSRENGRTLFALTLLICAVLLYFNIGCWKASAALIVTNVFSIQCTLSVMHLLGQEMNFILAALPVMVMVFTTGAAIHFIGQYITHAHERNGIGRAMKAVIWPSLFAALTTVIGLLSLAISDIGPIPHFGKAAAAGTIVSFIVGLGLTPAVLLAVKYRVPQSRPGQAIIERMGMIVLNHPMRVLIPMLLLTAFSAVGLRNIRTLIDPLEFLPDDDPVLRDTLHVKRCLTSPTTIEAVVDFAGAESSFFSRLQEVRRFEEALQKNANVCHTLSLADFFPAQLNEKDLSISKLVSSSGSEAAGSLMADGCRLWRVSIRLFDDAPAPMRQTLNDFQTASWDHQVTFTGLGPLLEKAQGDIFDGFWKSFSSAFLLITVVMVVALRSPFAGLIAMIPNIQPIVLVFGILGWMDYPVDIGIMMTASIALGLAVDGTFHFLFNYQSSLRATRCRYRSVRRALLHTGMPIITSGIISGVGLLALGMSPFRPTMRFGVLMFCLMTAATIGDLILLPAFLSIRTKRRRISRGASMPAISAHTRAA